MLDKDFTPGPTTNVLRLWNAQMEREMPASDELCNIAMRLRRCAETHPRKDAVRAPRGRDWFGRLVYERITFRDLDRESDACARGFERIGLVRGVRTLVMLRPGIDFYTVLFALWKTGAVPVLIDPGMGIDRLLRCIEAAQPEAMIGTPLAHWVRLLKPGAFRSLLHWVTVGRRWLWGGYALRKLRDRRDEALPLSPTRPGHLAAVLFTTGSTGPAKGVEYEHGMFDAQCELIRQTYGIGGDDIDLPTFPAFGLFSVALGMTVVIPRMDPTRPAEVDPRAIVEALRAHDCTFSFGSPALWGRVADYCAREGIRLETLRKVLMAGAPVPVAIHRTLLEEVLPAGAQTHTPYGATEALPVSDMAGGEVLEKTAELTAAGKGFCVGREVHGVRVEIIPIDDGPIGGWREERILSANEIGEIVVRGPAVTKRYYRNEEATRLAKIPDATGFWHRMGDVGYKDEPGRIWYCGRKAHRVRTPSGTLYTVCCEAIFNRHPAVKRTALVGIGTPPQQEPVLIVEQHPEKAMNETALREELREIGAEYEHTRGIGRILFHPAFPVDIRHNAKIFREKLAVWAAERLS